jgi:hypothetical protein
MKVNHRILRWFVLLIPIFAVLSVLIYVAPIITLVSIACFLFLILLVSWVFYVGEHFFNGIGHP